MAKLVPSAVSLELRVSSPMSRKRTRACAGCLLSSIVPFGDEIALSQLQQCTTAWAEVFERLRLASVLRVSVSAHDAVVLLGQVYYS